MELKIGIGYDSHRFCENRKLVLGGVEIPFEKGLLGHSDGDALIHSIIDALLGAAHLGDIGKMFPDNSDEFKDADSTELLKRAYRAVSDKEYAVINIDSVVILEKPKIAALTDKMEKNIASALCIPAENVSVKGKTNEGMGFVGRGEGIAAISTVLLRREK